MLAKGHGHLVAVSSLASYRGVPGGGAYSASKAALPNFQDLSPDQYRISPDNLWRTFALAILRQTAYSKDAKRIK